MGLWLSPDCYVSILVVKSLSAATAGHGLNTGKEEPLKKAQNDKIKNLAGSVWLSLFIDGSGKCKLPSTPLSRNQHLNMVIGNFEFYNFRRCAHMVVIMESSMRHKCHSMTSGVWRPNKAEMLLFGLYCVGMTYKLNIIMLNNKYGIHETYPAQLCL